MSAFVLVLSLSRAGARPPALPHIVLRCSVMFPVSCSVLRVAPPIALHCFTASGVVARRPALSGVDLH
eukprot:9208473-Lingulodinium_polyedra.AAC.1